MDAGLTTGESQAKHGSIGAAKASPKRSRLYSHCLHALPSICFIAFLTVLLYRIRSYADATGRATIDCDSGGNIYVVTPTFSSTPSIWNTDYTFTITIAFGAFKYTDVKIIDEAWNLIVGRGSQIVGTFAVYYNFRTPVVEVLGDRVWPYKTILAMQYSTISIDSLWKYMRETPHLALRSIRSFFTVLLLIVSTSFMLASPTWISTMTGYQAKMQPVMPWTDNTYISLSEVSSCMVIIGDGDRVGLQNNTCVPYTGPLANAVTNYVASWDNHGESFNEDNNLGDGYGDYWVQLDFVSINEVSSFKYNGHDYQLSSPTLKLKTLSDPVMQGEPVVIWTKFPTFVYNGQVLSVDDVQNRGICQPQKVYQWGFSFILLFAFLVTATALSTALYLFWLFTTEATSNVKTTSVYGLFKTAIEVGEHIRADLGHDVQRMSESGIRRELKERERVKLGGIRKVMRDLFPSSEKPPQNYAHLSQVGRDGI